MNTKQTPLLDTTIVCTVCGETSAMPWRVGVDHLLGGTHRYRAVRCVRCGTRRLDPRPDAETMAQYYRPETYARAEEEGSEVGKRLDAYAARLATSFPPLPLEDRGSRVLDVGCGDGRFMSALKQKGWHVTGTETDPAAAELARKRTGATVHKSPFPPETEGKFDLVSLLHVLEHVSDPRETLNGVRERLRPGGKLLLVLPNADSLEAGLFGSSWYHLDLPRHFWAFTPRSLVRLVETCGFAIDTVRYTPFLFAPQSLLRVFGKANGAIPGRHFEGTGRSEVGRGAWQTRVFTALLQSSDRAGKTVPGEIIELTASVSGGEAMIAALILAGGVLSPELVPFADGATNRALIRVGPNGETMLDLVVTAVRDGLRSYDGGAGRILVAGDVPLPLGCEAVDGGKSLVETLMNGSKAVRMGESQLLIATADAPFLTGESVADFLTRCEAVQPTQFAYPVIETKRCLSTFPGMKRTTLRIAEGEFTGGNLALLDPAFLRESETAIRDAYVRRKDIFRLAKMLGGGIILRLILSRVIPSLLGISHLEKAVGGLLRSSEPRAVITPFPEVGADVDRPEDIEIARKILANRIMVKQSI